jgi:hypothetical protein
VQKKMNAGYAAPLASHPTLYLKNRRKEDRFLSDQTGTGFTAIRQHKGLKSRGSQHPWKSDGTAKNIALIPRKLNHRVPQRLFEE